MTRFLVVVPTHRPHLAQETIDRLRESLTYPTEFHQVCGHPSKVHAINLALQTLLDPARHDLFCTVDDDVIMPENWQHSVACAFDRVKDLGACGIDLEGTPEGELYMAAAMQAPVQQVRDIAFRDTTNIQNVCGACITMPASLAKQIGPYPFTEDGRQYHADEDGWRCWRVIVMKKRHGYVVSPNGCARLVVYEDSPEYLNRKQADIANWQENPNWNNR